ncbi:hypothetical protein LEP1GSC193_2011 [Leptospira alstonii serovar Pingchang str. 80-412]|uniref:Uncharacterized protein n=2 Tax=Leptospira alstonii TaxID=28452 RepID=M6CNU1_9LEPT|nr:hypothetical protein LEP1GSC194_1683 [Leptospira alstonii serovar Sichuan str. 79601]EQA81519.1 hypothetical protein LEP1GSC193_2011 [Leptospira alstonii serovar Pingchang str. 80-412]
MWELLLRRFSAKKRFKTAKIMLGDGFCGNSYVFLFGL